VHRLPQLAPSSVDLAEAEVLAGLRPQRRPVAEGEFRQAMLDVTARIQGPASALCQEMNVGACRWDVHASPDSSLNAASGPFGLIIVNRGVLEYAAGEEEVCLVVAHEIGHQAANHYARAQVNRTMGALLGASLVGAATALATPRSRDVARAALSAARYGANIGAEIGAISFSKQQEREADYLAALILYRAGIDLDKARGMLVTLARLSRRMKTGLLDTHPAGPERLAGWDCAVADIRASAGSLPARA
jgi:predicted Zn-dependent protease